MVKSTDSVGILTNFDGRHRLVGFILFISAIGSVLIIVYLRVIEQLLLYYGNYTLVDCAHNATTLSNSTGSATIVQMARVPCVTVQLHQVDVQFMYLYAVFVCTVVVFSFAVMTCPSHMPMAATFSSEIVDNFMVFDLAFWAVVLQIHMFLIAYMVPPIDVFMFVMHVFLVVMPLCLLTSPFEPSAGCAHTTIDLSVEETLQRKGVHPFKIVAACLLFIEVLVLLVIAIFNGTCHILSFVALALLDVFLLFFHLYDIPDVKVSTILNGRYWFTFGSLVTAAVQYATWDKCLLYTYL